MKYLFAAIMLISLGCRQNSKNTSATQKPDSVETSIATKTDTTSEYIDWVKVKLNGTIPMLSSFKVSEKALGKPDSIVTPKYEDVSESFFNGKTFKYVYYKGLEFETENDSLALRHIDFNKAPALYLTTDKLKLSKAISLDEFKKQFPKSEQLPASTRDTTALFRLNVAKGNTDDAWILEFDTATRKLLTVEYFIPD